MFIFLKREHGGKIHTLLVNKTKTRMYTTIILTTFYTLIGLS